MAISPFDTSDNGPPLDATGQPILPTVQTPVPEQAPPPMPPAPMVPPPVDASLQGAPGAPQQPQDAGPLPWPDPAWMQPEMHPQGMQQAPEGPPVALQGSPPDPGAAGPPVDLQGPPVGLAGSTPPPPSAQELELSNQVPPGASAAKQMKPAGYLGQLDANAEAHRQALLAAAHAEQQLNDFNSSQGVLAAQNAAKQQQAADAEFLAANKAATTRRAALDNEAMKIANQQVDPRRAWHDASFGAKLAIGIATIVNGMVTKGNIGASPVVAMVNAICEQDMKAQEDALQNRTNMLGVRRGLLAEDVAAGRDLVDFKYKSIAAAYGMAENQIKAYALKFNNPVITAKAMEQLAQINDAKSELANKFHHQAVEEYFQGRAANNADRQTALQERKFNAEQAQTEGPNVPLMREQREAANDKAAKQVFLAHYKAHSKHGDEPVQGPNAAVTEDVNKTLAHATSFVQGIRRLKEIRKANGFKPFGSWGNDDMKEANAIYESLLTDFSNINHQGTIRDGEYERYEKMFGSIGGFIDPSANLDTLEHRAIQQANNELQGRIGPDVDFWKPQDTPGASPYFMAGGQPKKEPGVAGIPAQGQTGEEAPLSPSAQEFINTGKFKASTDSKALLDYAGGG